MFVVSKQLEEEFLRACGADGPLRVEVGRDGEPAERWILPQPFVVVGRDPGTDLCVDHPLISRRHAYLQVIAGRVFCIDLGSRTGTRWEDGFSRSGWLDDGHFARIGPAQIWPACGVLARDRALGRMVPNLNPLAPQPPEDDSLPVVRLDFPVRSGEIQSCPFDRVLMLVGRAPDCRLRLVDPDVSKYHCSLLRTSEGTWVVSLLGRGGIMVNGERVRFSRLEDGDRLQLGRHLIRLHFGACAETRQILPRPRPGVAEVASTPAAPLDGTGDRRFLAAWPPDQVELVGALLGEFRAMQQQIAEIQRRRNDELHHTMIMMFNSFVSMHNDQMRKIRGEMDHLNQLTREQRALESRLVKAGPTTPHAGEARPSRGDAPETNPEARAERPEQPPSTQAAADAGPATERRTEQARAAHDPMDEDIHAWINRRISSIRQERLGRWQKLINFMTGQMPEELLP
jgi:pSer/pThr/pTyr-binding forkhead associated (FHA) protein